MDDKTRELMAKLVAEKKEKSANQGGYTQGPDKLGVVRQGRKKHKKGGLFDK